MRLSCVCGVLILVCVYYSIVLHEQYISYTNTKYYVIDTPASLNKLKLS